jgi:hypothetical protein
VKMGEGQAPELANPKAANSTQNPMDWKVLYSTFVKCQEPPNMVL